MVCYHILKIIFMAVPSFQLPFPQVTTWKLLWSDPLKKSTRFLSYFYSFVFFGFGTGLNHWEHTPNRIFQDIFPVYLAFLHSVQSRLTKNFLVVVKSFCQKESSLMVVMLMVMVMVMVMMV